MVAKIQFQVDMSIKALFPNDQREVENIVREKNHNMKKQLKQRRKKKWKKFIDRPNYGYYVRNENMSEKSVIETTQIIDRMRSADTVKSGFHKKVTVRKDNQKSYTEIVRECSSRNNNGLNFSEKFVSTEDVSKISIYKMELKN